MAIKEKIIDDIAVLTVSGKLMGGDETFEDWIGPYESGETINLDHTWDEQGTYTLRAKAKDIYDSESDWSILEVKMPVNKFFSNSIFLNLINQIIRLFPNMFPVIKYITGLSNI